jgi:hypothetical protein
MVVFDTEHTNQYDDWVSGGSFATDVSVISLGNGLRVRDAVDKGGNAGKYVVISPTMRTRRFSFDNAPVLYSFLDTFMGSSSLAAHTPDVGGPWIDGWTNPGMSPASDVAAWTVAGGGATYPVPLSSVSLTSGEANVSNASGPPPNSFPFTVTYRVSFATPTNTNLYQTALVGLGPSVDYWQVYLMLELNSNPGFYSLQGKSGNSIWTTNTNIPVTYNQDINLTYVVHSDVSATFYLDGTLYSQTITGSSPNPDLGFISFDAALESPTPGSVTTVTLKRVEIKLGEHPPELA